jgi:hypothetical protein
VKIVEALLVALFSDGERHARRMRLIADVEVPGDTLPVSAG